MNRPSYFESSELPVQAPSKRREYVGVGDVLNLIVGNMLLLLTTSAIALAIGLFYYATAVPSYRAEAQLMLDPKLPQFFRDASDLGLAVDTGQIETHMVVLRSRGIAGAVVDRLKLWNDPDFQRTPSRFRLSRLLGRSEAAGDPKQVAADIFLENLRVDREGISQVIDVAFESHNRERAAQIANETTRAYVEYLINVRAEAARTASDWLEERLKQLRLQMNAAAKRTQNFRANSESATLEELQLSAETYRKVYQDFYSAFTEAVQKESYPVSTVRVVSEAPTPLWPSSPSPMLVLGSALLIGLGSGLVLAILRDGRGLRQHVPAPRAPRKAA
jgi:uncharacterized protein involved in exopolysaccharide biosynthesis